MFKKIFNYFEYHPYQKTIAVNDSDKNGLMTTINKLDIPEPKITINPISKNVPRDNLYLSEFEMKIDGQIPIPNFYIQANASSIINLQVISQEPGMLIVQGQSGNREGFSFMNIPQAYGKYRITISSRELEKITFSCKLNNDNLFFCLE